MSAYANISQDIPACQANVTEGVTAIEAGSMLTRESGIHDFRCLRLQFTRSLRGEPPKMRKS
jgi:hypothetical protein